MPRLISSRMDKLTLLSIILFVTADVFAIGSLANPEWIVTNEAGNMRLGLTQQCQVIQGRPEMCFFPRLTTEWMLAFAGISVGILCVTIAWTVLLLSHWWKRLVKHARWLAFFGMICFCMAAVVFPIGFHMDEIGGEPYKLPNHTQVGTSYVLFIMAIFFTILSELFTGRICLPHMM